MVTIWPVSENDLEIISREVRRKDFEQPLLGMRGLFVCGRKGPLTLTQVTVQEAETLLCGRDVNGTREVRRGPNELAAWQFSFRGSQHLSVLHAMAPENDACKIREAHVQATLTVLREAAGCLTNMPEERGCIGVLLDKDVDVSHRSLGLADRKEFNSFQFLVLTSVTSADGTPNLHTTAFLNNTTVNSDGSIQALAKPEDVLRIRFPLRESYAGALDYFTEKAIGPFQRVPNVNELRIVGIPHHVVEKVFFGDLLDCGANKKAAHIALDKREMLTAWRAQGEAFGWGPKEAAALLRGFRREQFWNEVKVRCINHPARSLLNATASLSRLITREETQLQPPEKNSKNQDNQHTQSHSQ